MRRFALLVPLFAAGACSLFGGGKQGPAQVSELVGWVERTYVEVELAKVRVATAVGKLEVMASGEFRTDPVLVYTELVAAIERSEQQAAKLRAAVDPMKAAAAPVFEEWTENLERFTSERLRGRSAARLAATKERYDAIVAAVDPALEDLTKLNAGLRDHALFLGNDLNPGAVAALQDDVTAMAQLASGLAGRLDQTLETARAYVDIAALPAATPASR